MIISVPTPRTQSPHSLCSLSSALRGGIQIGSTTDESRSLPPSTNGGKKEKQQILVISAHLPPPRFPTHLMLPFAPALVFNAQVHRSCGVPRSLRPRRLSPLESGCGNGILVCEGIVVVFVVVIIKLLDGRAGRLRRPWSIGRRHRCGLGPGAGAGRGHGTGRAGSEVEARHIGRIRGCVLALFGSHCS